MLLTYQSVRKYDLSHCLLNNVSNLLYFCGGREVNQLTCLCVCPFINGNSS